MTDPKAIAARLREIVALEISATTMAGHKFIRYEHGGARLYHPHSPDDRSGRTLIADFYHEADRELFYALRNSTTLLSEAADAIERMEKALISADQRLNCRGDPNREHYCPNCDNSMYKPHSIIREALQPKASTND